MPSGGGVSPHLTRGSHQLLQQLHLHTFITINTVPDKFILKGQCHEMEFKYLF
jgi:hypothetical protein